MAASSPSANSLPAGFAESYLKVMVDLMGRHGADAVLRRSGLQAWIGRPEAALAGETLGFAEAGRLLSGLEETLGARGARGLEKRMGAAAFERVVRPVGAVWAMRDPGFQAFPVERRLRAGMYGLARVLSAMTSVVVTTREDPGGVLWRSDPCPDCSGRTTTAPVCSAMLGMLSAAAAWIAAEAEVRVDEVACHASGAAACEFLVRYEAGA